MNPDPARRQRNPRGRGAALRVDILAAATALLEEAGNEDAVNLRAVARRVGISAPAIYAHFPNRQAVLAAVVDAAFADLSAALATATASCADPVVTLRAICGTYWRFAEERPGRFQLLFGRSRVMTDGLPRAESVTTMIGSDSFGRLVAAIEGCVAAGRSGSTDPVHDATMLWLALHGYATLSASVPYFPWPERELLLDGLLDRLVLTT